MERKTNEKLPKFLLIFLSILLCLFLLPSFVFSSISESIPVLIMTPQLAVGVSLVVTVDPAVNIVYDVMPIGTQDAAPNNDPLITVTNNGSVPEDFLIKGANTLTGETPWTLADVQGEDQYVHKFGLSPSFSTWTTLATTDKALASNKNTGEDSSFKLRISLPTSVTAGQTQHTTSVTVTAVQH